MTQDDHDEFVRNYVNEEIVADLMSETMGSTELVEVFAGKLGKDDSNVIVSFLKRLINGIKKVFNSKDEFPNKFADIIGMFEGAVKNGVDNASDTGYNNTRYKLVKNDGVDVFPPYNESGSDTNERATRWAHKRDIEDYTQKFFYHEGIRYLVEKDSSLSLGYRVLKRVTNKEFELWRELYNEGDFENGENSYKEQRNVRTVQDNEAIGRKAESFKRGSGYGAISDKHNGKAPSTQGMGGEQNAERETDVERGRASERGVEDTQGEVKKKYSFAGYMARTSDRSMLQKAVQMELDGKTEKTIYRETGWYRGSEGRWRFEISDKDSRYYPDGDAQFAEDHPEYARYSKLYDKLLNGDISDREYREYSKLYDTWERERRRLSAKAKKGNVKLYNILSHPTLFEAYPWLKKITVRFAYLDKNQRAAAIADTIFINKRLPKDRVKSSLLHEIQHLIQVEESFARGASVQYWESAMPTKNARDLYMNTAGEIEARQVQERMDWTNSQRRKKMPFISDENTVTVPGDYLPVGMEDNDSETGVALSEKGLDNQSDSGDNTKRITADMSDSERTEILARKSIVAPIYEGQADSLIETNSDDLNSEKISTVKNAIVRIGEEFGVIGNEIRIDDVEVVITPSRKNLKESLSKETTPTELAKLLPILKDSVSKAIGVERHDNRYYFDTDTVYFENLLGGYVDGEEFVPVRFGLKHSKTGNTVLYVVVDQNRISLDVLEQKKKTEVVNTAAPYNTESSVSRSVEYSISQIIPFVKSKDLLRYIPDNMLNSEQKKVKWEGISETIVKTNNKNDEHYSDYIRKDNLTAAKRMVEEAARKNGYTVKAFHGTANGGFTQFDTYDYYSKFGLFGNGAYFTEDKDIAEQYTKKGRGNKPQVYSVFLNITNPIDMDAKADIEAWNEALQKTGEDFSLLDGEMTNEQAFKRMVEDLEYAEVYSYDAAEIVRNVFENMGYNGITHIGGGRVNRSDGTKHRVWIAFEPEQIKSADPVTYDDDGNVIPLSERFNPEKTDIRYSLTDTGVYSLEDAWAEKVKKYGAIPRGEKAARDVKVPKKISDNKYVSRTARSAIEAD